jgi:hypothetical protein
MKRRLAERRRVTVLRLWKVLFASACAATVTAMGCHGVADTARDITVRETIAPQPVRIGVATLAIQLADTSAKPVTHATISVEGDMSHPGMSPIFGRATETSPGIYGADLNFNMAGDWIVLSHIVLPDGRKMDRRFDVSSVEPN